MQKSSSSRPRFSATHLSRAASFAAASPSPWPSYALSPIPLKLQIGLHIQAAPGSAKQGTAIKTITQIRAARRDKKHLRQHHIGIATKGPG